MIHMGSLQTASVALGPEAAVARPLVLDECRVRYSTYYEQANDDNYNGILLKCMNRLLKIKTDLANTLISGSVFLIPALILIKIIIYNSLSSNYSSKHSSVYKSLKIKTSSLSLF